MRSSKSVGRVGRIKHMNAPADAPVGGELWQLTGEELRDELQAAERVLNRAFGRSLQVISEFLARGDTCGYSSLRRYLHDALNVTDTDARHRITYAQALIGTRAVTGTVMPAPLAETGRAVVEGVVSPKQVEQIHKTLTDLPDGTPSEVRAQAEHDLVDAAQKFDPVQVARVGQRIHAHLDPDGPEP
ncbi:MAG: DUF222 domain-containing protein, partial [Pseudonocardiaceae bacterium]|nr:DUF222 domain-containing protein [Pseudonocardiaceae bacterium]